jgi:cytoskeleton protein RodZ
MPSPSRNHYTPSSDPRPAQPENREPSLLDAANAPPRPPRAQREPPQERDRIGDILRRVREGRGESLHVISDSLRIRPTFLAALDNSRYDEFAADAYVIGFLRTYADYLGLDSKAAVDLYRREMAGRRRKPQLNMPKPITEGRAPTVAILIGAAMAALMLYALWYALSTTSRTVQETPPSLPQTSQASPSSETQPATAETLSPSTKEMPASSLPSTAPETKTSEPASAQSPDITFLPDTKSSPNIPPPSPQLPSVVVPPETPARTDILKQDLSGAASAKPEENKQDNKKAKNKKPETKKKENDKKDDKKSEKPATESSNSLGPPISLIPGTKNHPFGN